MPSMQKKLQREARAASMNAAQPPQFINTGTPSPILQMPSQHQQYVVQPQSVRDQWAPMTPGSQFSSSLPSNLSSSAAQFMQTAMTTTTSTTSSNTVGGQQALHSPPDMSQFQNAFQQLQVQHPQQLQMQPPQQTRLTNSPTVSPLQNQQLLPPPGIQQNPSREIASPQQIPQLNPSITFEMRQFAISEYCSYARQAGTSDRKIQKQLDKYRNGELEDIIIAAWQQKQILNTQAHQERQQQQQEQEQYLKQQNQQLEAEQRRKQQAAEAELARKQYELAQREAAVETQRRQAELDISNKQNQFAQLTNQAQQALQSQTQNLTQQQQQLQAQQQQVQVQQQQAQSQQQQTQIQQQQLQTQQQAVANQEQALKQQAQQALLTTQTLTTTQMIAIQGSARGGKSRKEAITGGATALAAYESRVQRALQQVGDCPRGFDWLPKADGFLCSGGSHFIPDHEVEKMLSRSAFYMPHVEVVNLRWEPSRGVSPPPGARPVLRCHRTYAMWQSEQQGRGQGGRGPRMGGFGIPWYGMDPFDPFGGYGL